MPVKGKVERPYRYVREDFFLGARFRDLEDLNLQFRHWLDRVAPTPPDALSPNTSPWNCPIFKRYPPGRSKAVPQLERRITRDGMISLHGNLYSVPNATRRRIVEVHSTASEVRILEDGHLIVTHPVLEGRGHRRIAAGHRTLPPPANSNTLRHGAIPARTGEIVTPRSLAFYDAVARRLATITGPQP